MAAGKFEFETAVFGSVLASAFSKDFKPVNPFDRRQERPRTAEEIEEERRAIEAKAEVERRVRAKQFQRMTEGR